MKDEALKKAEHALEGVLQVPEKISMMHILDVVRFIRQAREEKQQEPVAWIPIITWRWNNNAGTWEGLTNTSPPARKPLTDEEIESMWIGSVGFLNPMLNQHTRLAFARAIEAKHNIKE